MRLMKLVQRFFVALVLAGVSLARTAIAADEPLVSYHFIGATALANNTNAAKLKQIWALPETMKLRDDVLRKLSRVSAKILGANSATANEAALLRPIFDDLMSAESLAELRGEQKAKATLFLAARLSDERSKLWEKNLRQLLKSSKPQALKVENATGWQTKAGAHTLTFLRADKWTALVIGPGESPAEFLKRLKKTASLSADKSWLDADIDWPRLKALLPVEKLPLKLARTEVQVVGKGENLRTTARILYPQKIEWKSEPWRIPKELIRDPLISFTAAQRIEPFLQKPIFPAQIVSNPATNQIFFWGQSQMPFQFYCALPVKNATNTMKTLGPQLATAFNDDLLRRDGGTLEMASNRVDLIWKSLPIIAPFLRPVVEAKGAGQYLLGGLFPIAPSTNSAPAELFAQISGRKDVVYYDWEITQERLGQWSMVGQLLPLFPKVPIVSTNAALSNRLAPARMPEMKWLGTVGPKLGNTVTEVTYESPTELKLVRKSHIGFNSVELILVSHWLAHPDFPFVNPLAASHVAGKGASPVLPLPAGKP
jgi:hypothetical protein